MHSLNKEVLQWAVPFHRQFMQFFFGLGELVQLQFLSPVDFFFSAFERLQFLTRAELFF